MQGARAQGPCKGSMQRVRAIHGPCAGPFARTPPLKPDIASLASNARNSALTPLSHGPPTRTPCMDSARGPLARTPPLKPYIGSLASDARHSASMPLLHGPLARTPTRTPCTDPLHGPIARTPRTCKGSAWGVRGGGRRVQGVQGAVQGFRARGPCKGSVQGVSARGARKGSVGLLGPFPRFWAILGHLGAFWGLETPESAKSRIY